MLIDVPVLRSCKVTNLSKKVIEQLRVRVILLMEIRLKGHFFQALNENKLFILDYHDIYLPFLNRINSLDDRKAYGTRTLFFLTTVGTLKPIAIELSLPPTDPNCPLKQVLTPSVDATTSWLWQLGKAHVCSNDAGVHQLIHHWYALTTMGQFKPTD